MDSPQQVSPRHPRPFGLAIAAVIILLVGGYIWWQGRGDDCANWQADHRAAVEAVEEDPSEENVAHAVGVLSRQPDDCPQDL